MSAQFKHLPYRQGVGIMLLSANKQVFVAKRIDMKSEAWQMPQGGIDPGETAEQAALRELEEEVGTHKARILGASKEPYYYDLPAYLVPQVWGGKYRGQAQHWFVMRFDGIDADINIHTKEPEFSEWRWATPKELPDIIVPFKRDIYSQLVEEFSAFLK